MPGQSPDELFDLWRGWLDHGGPVFNDIFDGLIVSRHIWRGYREVLFEIAPPEARANATFDEWIRYMYVRTAGTAVRRQCDPGRDHIPVSIAGIMRGLTMHPEVLAWERFRSGRPHESDDEARERWDVIRDSTGNRMDPAIPARDLGQLRQDTKKVRTWVNKVVAHYDGVVFRIEAGFSAEELNASIDAIFAAFDRYRGYFTGATISAEVAMTPWQQVFTVAWLPDWRAYLTRGRSV